MADDLMTRDTMADALRVANAASLGRAARISAAAARPPRRAHAAL